METSFRTRQNIIFATSEIMEDGFKKYTRNMWNVVDFAQVSAYLASVALRFVVYFGPDLKVTSPADMDSSDPILVADSFFAGANIISIMKLLTLFISNSELGPLQITLGRMMIDVVKFFFIFFLVLLSFASGLNQLLFLEYTVRQVSCLITIPF